MSEQNQTQTQEPQSAAEAHIQNQNPHPAINPFAVVKSADDVLSVNQYNLSSSLPVTGNGATVKQTFVETPTKHLLPGMVVSLPRFAPGQSPSNDNMLLPGAYFVVSGQSIGGDAIFLTKLQLGQGNEHENQALLDAGLQGAYQIQVASSAEVANRPRAGAPRDRSLQGRSDQRTAGNNVHQRQPEAERLSIQIGPHFPQVGG